MKKKNNKNIIDEIDNGIRIVGNNIGLTSNATADLSPQLSTFITSADEALTTCASSLGGCVNTTPSYYNTTPSYYYNSNGTVSINSSGFYSDIDFCNYDVLVSFLKYITEEKILEIFNIIYESGDTDYFNRVFSFFIRHRHVSEDFLLNFSEILKKEDVFVLHESDIKSNLYKTLAVLFELKNE